MSELLSDLAWFDFLQAHGLEWLPVYIDMIFWIILGVCFLAYASFKVYEWIDYKLRCRRNSK